MSKTATPTDFAVETWAIDRPKPYDKNARVIPKAAVEKVAASIKQYGWQQAIVVDKKGVIIAGHTRLLAAKLLGLTEVPVKVAANLTPAQVRTYRIMDNRSAEETKWDMPMLAEELQAIGKDGDDLAALTGFDTKELDKLLTPEHPPTESIGKGDALSPKTATGASKILHSCPACGHSWHAGPAKAPAVKAKKNPFGAVDEEA